MDPAGDTYSGFSLMDLPQPGLIEPESIEPEWRAGSAWP